MWSRGRKHLPVPRTPLHFPQERGLSFPTNSFSKSSRRTGSASRSFSSIHSRVSTSQCPRDNRKFPSGSLRSSGASPVVISLSLGLSEIRTWPAYGIEERSIKDHRNFRTPASQGWCLDPTLRIVFRTSVRSGATWPFGAYRKAAPWIACPTLRCRSISMGESNAGTDQVRRVFGE